MTAARDPASPVILLLAAGEGSRFGSVKQLADIAGEPMVRRVARTLLLTDLPVIVVTGAYAEPVEAALHDLPLLVIRCEDWMSGMGHSLAAGVREVVRTFPHASSVLICLADQPMLGQASIVSMLQRHQAAPDRILVTQHADTQGPPALFPRDCFNALAALSGTRGARAVLERESSRVEKFAVGDGMDVDTPQDLQRVQALLAHRLP
jgi:CTP:molybdopterin cytidylyltransferase MocA